MDVGAPLVEIWRGALLESVHGGHAVIADATGQIREAWGDPDTLIFPRSACKMVQALPLARAGLGLTPERLALACASHQGAALHRTHVESWLGDLGFGDDALLCGPQPPRDDAERVRLIREGGAVCQVHSNCSGKHAGFLHLARYLGAASEGYIAPDHPVQRAVRQAFEDSVGEDSPTWAIDGCSAPNFACTLTGLARAMAGFAAARDGAEATLRAAMMAHPELVAGETRACTELMRAAPGVALKTGAEGVFVAILQDRGLGIALKVSDGATRAAQAAITALLIRLGAVAPGHPAALKRLGPITNWAGRVTGRVAVGAALA
ncbi:MAG: asparaginase [Pseudomonadota bacterium]